MLLYLSKNKIENLHTEFNINKNFVEEMIPNYIKARWGIKFGVAEGLFESEHTIRDTSNLISQVLKKLKSKNELIELTSSETYIKPFNYYICYGNMSYEGLINGVLSDTIPCDVLAKCRQWNSFLADDKLKFKVKISHDKYKYVDITCSADSMLTFLCHRLSDYSDAFQNIDYYYYTPNGSTGDPGTLFMEVPVRIVFWCLNENDALGKITGSPLMISC